MNAIFATFCACSLWLAPQAGEFANETMVVGSVMREYRLVVPQSIDLHQPCPLVIAFHGIAIDSKDLMPRYSQLNETATKHRFIIAYPNAVDRRWGFAPAKVKDDLAMFDALLAKLTSSYRIDLPRVYVLGMSNGSYFAQLASKERSAQIAAVAAHSGPFGLQWRGGINSQRKFPVLIVHGDQDRFFAPQVFYENRDQYRREGHVVQHIEVPGLGHRWATQSDINETIWKFFEAHPLPEGQ